MADPLKVTIIYEPDEDGFIFAWVAELPSVLTKGHTRDEARALVLSALRDWSSFYVADERGDAPVDVPEGANSESLALTLA